LSKKQRIFKARRGARKDHTPKAFVTDERQSRSQKAEVFCQKKCSGKACFAIFFFVVAKFTLPFSEQALKLQFLI